MPSDYDLMNEVVTSLADCSGLECTYESFVAMGRPSDPVGENCGLIGIWKESRVPAFRDRGRCEIYATDTFHIRLVKCCGDIDTTVERNLNPGFDESLARCFYNDVETVYCCLTENLPAILKQYNDISCNRKNVIERVQYDESLLGTCFGVTYSFDLTRDGICCEPAE